MSGKGPGNMIGLRTTSLRPVSSGSAAVVPAVMTAGPATVGGQATPNTTAHALAICAFELDE
jgi:hypothetical protein